MKQKGLQFPLFTAIYFTLVLIILAVDLLNLRWAYFLTKPMALIFIFIFYLFNSQHQKGKAFRAFILPAFLFCSLGDAFMMFMPVSENYFIAGLGAFLIGHILLTSSFASEIITNKSWNQHWLQLAFSTLIVVYGAEFFILNRAAFGELWFPVLIYCFAISAMGVAATMRDYYASRQGYFKVIIGAIFFILSDSLLAVNKFVVPFEYAGTLILATYFLAQYLIATGCLANGLNSENPRK